MTPDDNDRVEIDQTALAFAEWQLAGITPPDIPALRAYRLSRLQEQIWKHDCAGLLLFDLLNIRYATDCTNMQLWIAHNPARAVFVPLEGKMILWDFHNCEHLSGHLPLIGELRGGASFFYFETGDQTAKAAKDFAKQIIDVMAKHAGANKRLAVDRIEHVGYAALCDLGVTVLEGQVLTEHARSIKNDNELNAMRCAIHACEASIDEMRAVMRPGLSENELWAVLHAGNIKRDDEWIETRILASGPRTNPWFQECGPRLMQAGDLMAFDTDLVGTYGYCCDISRTWIIGYAAPNDRQKHLYQTAYDHVMTNIGLIEAGMSFADVTRVSHRLPEMFRPLRYGGCFEVGMTLCVEAYIGAVGGHDGVKLEEQVLITDSGAVPLSTYRYEAAFLD